MKELIEKMHACIISNYEDCKPLEEYAKNCSQVATEHFADKWIKVEDKLPEDFQVVYFYSKHGVMQGRFFNDTDGNFQFFISENGVRFSISEVSHWMNKALPQPPKQ